TGRAALDLLDANGGLYSFGSANQDRNEWAGRFAEEMNYVFFDPAVAVGFETDRSGSSGIWGGGRSRCKRGAVDRILWGERTTGRSNQDGRRRGDGDAEQRRPDSVQGRLFWLHGGQEPPYRSNAER